MGEIQKPNKSAEQIGEVGRIRPPIWGGGGGLTWVPRGAQVPVLSPHDQPNPSQRQRKSFIKFQIFKNFQVLLDSLTIVKTVKCKGPYEGGLGVPGVGTWDPRHGSGGHSQEKMSKNTHSGHSTQRSFDPLPAPNPQPPKKGYPGTAGYGGQNQKSIGQSFSVLK